MNANRTTAAWSNEDTDTLIYIRRIRNDVNDFKKKIVNEKLHIKLIQ